MRLGCKRLQGRLPGLDFAERCGAYDSRASIYRPTRSGASTPAARADSRGARLRAHVRPCLDSPEATRLKKLRLPRHKVRLGSRRAGGVAPERSRYNDSAGQVEVLYTDGPLNMAHSAFFKPLGSNGRGCVTCHQPASGWGYRLRSSKAAGRSRTAMTRCLRPSMARTVPVCRRTRRVLHSLLLSRGLFRVSLPWPPEPAPDGASIQPEFTIEVVRDPTSCNTDPVYGLKSAEPRISVFRRPRVVANLKYVAVDGGGESTDLSGPSTPSAWEW